MSMLSDRHSNALVLFSVGPARICSPVLPVESIIFPPLITATPDASTDEPGVFDSINGIVRVVDLRVRFGVEAQQESRSGKIIITEIASERVGFWVDEIEGIMEFPEKGWCAIPACIPVDVFSRALLIDDVIRLYAEFDKLDAFKAQGYLAGHIAALGAEKKEHRSSRSRSRPEPARRPTSQGSKIEKPVTDRVKQVVIEPGLRARPGQEPACRDNRMTVEPVRKTEKQRLAEVEPQTPVASESRNPRQATINSGHHTRQASTASITSEPWTPRQRDRKETPRMTGELHVIRMNSGLQKQDYLLLGLVLLLSLVVLMTGIFITGSFEVLEVRDNPVESVPLDAGDKARDVMPAQETEEKSQENNKPGELVIVLNDESTHTGEPGVTPGIETTRYQHIVKKGDTLWDIAGRYVQRPWEYPELARLSRIDDPDLIYPGQTVIVIVKRRTN